MALTKETTVDQITVLEDGQIQIRTTTSVLEDGIVLSKSFHRKVISPGADYSSEADNVKVVAQAVHTQAVIDAYQASQAQIQV